MSGIEMTVYAMKIRGFLCLLIIKVSVLSFFCQLGRKQIFMAFYAAALISVDTGMLQPSFLFPVK